MHFIHAGNNIQTKKVAKQKKKKTGKLREVEERGVPLSFSLPGNPRSPAWILNSQPSPAGVRPPKAARGAGVPPSAERGDAAPAAAGRAGR